MAVWRLSAWVRARKLDISRHCSHLSLGAALTKHSYPPHTILTSGFLSNMEGDFSWNGIVCLQGVCNPIDCRLH